MYFSLAYPTNIVYSIVLQWDVVYNISGGMVGAQSSPPCHPMLSLMAADGPPASCLLPPASLISWHPSIPNSWPAPWPPWPATWRCWRDAGLPPPWVAPSLASGAPCLWVRRLLPALPWPPPAAQHQCGDAALAADMPTGLLEGATHMYTGLREGARIGHPVHRPAQHRGLARLAAE